MRSIVTGKLPGMPSIKMVLIDVRDCAEHHYKALTVPEANGKRFLSCFHNLWMEEIGQILHAKYGKHYKVSTGKMPKCMCWVGSLFNSEMALLYEMWGLDLNIDVTQTLKYLGSNFIAPERSLHEMIDSLI